MKITKLIWLYLSLVLLTPTLWADAVSDIANSPNYSTTYGASNILGAPSSIGERGYINDSLRADHWQQSYTPQPSMHGMVDPLALIRSIQTLLAKVGLNPGPADGRMGMQTHNAILQYQHQHQLFPSGMPTPDLWRHLNAESKAMDEKAASTPADE